MHNNAKLAMIGIRCHSMYVRHLDERQHRQ
jgi:hypothetical protein